MTNREHIAIIFSKEISNKEKHQATAVPGIAETIRVREALLFLAESIDEIERKQKSWTQPR